MSENKKPNRQPSDEFGNHIAKLLTLLKKVLKNNKINQEDLKKVFGETKIHKDNMNLNVFFLTLMPMSLEEMEDYGSGLEEIFDEVWDKEEEQELKFEISSTDEEFLKSNGIKF